LGDYLYHSGILYRVSLFTKTPAKSTEAMIEPFAFDIDATKVMTLVVFAIGIILFSYFFPSFF